MPAYYYVINFGKTITGEPFVPFRGKRIPGSFEGNAPNPALKGGVQKFNYKDGSLFAMRPKNPIRPMNYIKASQFKLNNEFRKLLTTLKGK